MTSNQSLTAQSAADLYEDTKTFNRLAGNLKEGLTRKNLEDQVKLVMEEAYELQEAFNEDNKVEMLDACVDILVVTFGMMQKLQLVYQANLPQAMDITADNNLTKFPTSRIVAESTVDMYKQQGIICTIEEDAETGCFVIKNTEGKVMKPIGYAKNNLVKCFPVLQ